MDASLQQKCDLLGDNYKVVRHSGRLDFQMADSLGALIFTADNAHADEAAIRENRKLLKSKVGIMSELRHETNMVLLCKMSMAEDPEQYLDNVIAAYNCLKQGKLLRTEFMSNAAITLVDHVEPAQYEQVAAQAKQIVNEVFAKHPVITGQQDLSMAILLVTSGIDINTLLSRSESCFQALAAHHLFADAGALQTVAFTMALSEKPQDEKVERYYAIKDAMRDSGHHLRSSMRAIMGGFTDVDATPQEIAELVGEVDNYLKHKHGFGNLTSGHQIRRVYASALALQYYQEHQDAGQSATAISSAVATDVIQTILIAIIITLIIAEIEEIANNN